MDTVIITQNTRPINTFITAGAAKFDMEIDYYMSEKAYKIQLVSKIYSSINISGKNYFVGTVWSLCNFLSKATKVNKICLFSG